MDLYRAVPKLQLQPGARLHRAPGRRLPGNIPYPVDNLWEFTRPPTLSPMVRMPVPDAREHSDVGHLQKLINQRLRQLPGAGVAAKQPLAALFLPGVAKHQLLIAMEISVLLADLVSEAAAKVGLWQTARVVDGELFFEIAEDNFYVLQPL